MLFIHFCRQPLHIAHCTKYNSGKIGKSGKSGVGLQTSLLYIYYKTSIYVEYKNKKVCGTPLKIPDFPKIPDFNYFGVTNFLPA